MEIKIRQALFAYIESEVKNDITISDKIELRINKLFGYFEKDSQGKVVNEVKGTFNQSCFDYLWQSIRTGFQILGEFKEYKGQLYCYDVNGKGLNDILASYNYSPSRAKDAEYFTEQTPSELIKNDAKLQYDNELIFNTANYKDDILEYHNQRSKESYEYKIKKISESDYIKRAVINPMVLFRELHQFGKWVNDGPLSVEDQLSFTFKNKFDSVPENKVIEYFKAELVDTNYLSEKDLHDFIKLAFELEKKPENRFRLSTIEYVTDIYDVFYYYYKEIACKPPKRQNKYVDLLGVYFEGFNSNTIKTNWARGHEVFIKKLTRNGKKY